MIHDILRRSALAAALAGLTLISACSDSTVDPGESNKFSTVLSDISKKVILPTYADLDEHAGELQEAVEALVASPTESTLAAAREAWRHARSPWEQSEGFLFGPVDTEGIDPSIDSWPVNYVDLDAVLNGSAALTKEYIDGLEGTLKGFHTIEYLLFGQGGTRKAADLTPRQLEYLTGVTASFKGATAELYDSWNPAGENFVAQLADAGKSGSSYISQQEALQELVDGMIGICDEVAKGKINDPYSQGDRTLEESQFSNNSNTDFQDNIRSVKNVYLGAFHGNSGAGLTTIVAERNAALDTRVKSEIDAAIAAIGQMTPNFGEAITNNKPKVDAALEAINTLMETLDGELRPLIQGL